MSAASKIAAACLLASVAAGMSLSPVRAMPSDHAFDCADARTATERTICAYPRLKRLDDRIAMTYYILLNDLADPAISNSAKASLRSSQRQHIRGRDACGSNVACLDDVLSLRASRIQNYRG